MSLDPNRKTPPTPTVPTTQIDQSVEYGLVRRDLWRLTVYSVICFALMIAVLLVVG